MSSASRLSDASAGSAGSDGDQDDAAHIRVRLVSTVAEFRVTDSELAVPETLGRRGLSQVVNHLLSLEPAVPFDFLIKAKDTLVRTSLARHCELLGLSTESAVLLEFTPAVRQPELSAQSQWPDWLGAVDASVELAQNQGSLVVSGAYDGQVQLSRLSKQGKLEVMGTWGQGGAAVKAVRCFGSDASRPLVASGGKDGAVRLLRVSLGGSAKKPTAELSALTACEGHSSSVEALDALQLSEHAVVASGGWDSTVRLWKLPLDEVARDEVAEVAEAEGGRSRKARKTDGARIAAAAAAARGQRVATVTACTTFAEHGDKVAAVCWEASETPTTVYSGSWDHSIRAWDVTRETCAVELRGNKVVTALAHQRGGSSMLASAHADHCVRLWDARVTGDSVAKLALKSHKAWVAAVSFCPTNDKLLASCAHDRTLKVWDLRSSVPLHTVEDHTNKVLAVDWTADGKALVSGGADAILRAHVLA
jgi:ribosome biogenesis protein YTM1